jgi:hypothetical protein
MPTSIGPLALGGFALGHEVLPGREVEQVFPARPAYAGFQLSQFLLELN